jgi:chromosome segregation ATPase
MQTIEEQLKQLQEENTQLEQQIASTTEQLQAWQHRRKELKARLAPLEQLSNELAASRGALVKQREAAQQTIDAAKKTRGDLLARLNTELPKESAAEIEAGVKKIDQEIADARKAVSDLQTQIGAADTALAEAQGRAKAAEAATHAARTQLRQIAKPVQSAQERVTKLQADALAAAAAGQTRKAYYLALELGQALDELGRLADPQQEAALLKQVDDSRAAQVAALQETDEKAAALKGLKDELPSKERDLKNKEQQREAQIKPLLAATPPAPGGQQREIGAPTPPQAEAA